MISRSWIFFLLAIHGIDLVRYEISMEFHRYCIRNRISQFWRNFWSFVIFSVNCHFYYMFFISILLTIFQNNIFPWFSFSCVINNIISLKKWHYSTCSSYFFFHFVFPLFFCFIFFCLFFFLQRDFLFFQFRATFPQFFFLFFHFVFLLILMILSQIKYEAHQWNSKHEIISNEISTNGEISVRNKNKFHLLLSGPFWVDHNFNLWLKWWIRYSSVGLLSCKTHVFFFHWECLYFKWMMNSLKAKKNCT